MRPVFSKFPAQPVEKVEDIKEADKPAEKRGRFEADQEDKEERNVRFFPLRRFFGLSCWNPSEQGDQLALKALFIVLAWDFCTTNPFDPPKLGLHDLGSGPSR